MEKITIYQAVCSSFGSKCWFTVNGGWCDTESEARSKANRHVGVKDGAGQIERIDTAEVWADEFYNPKRY